MNRMNLLWVVYEALPEGASADPWELIEGAVAPILSIVEATPGLRLSLHMSGRTLEALARRPGVLNESLRATAARGQLELLGGGYAAPILSAIPQHDALSQLRQSAEHIARLSGHPPGGIWLTERVWEPALPLLLASNGVQYTFLDSRQIAAGVAGNRTVKGTWSVERLGYRLTLFPIDRVLERLWNDPQPGLVLEYLAERARRQSPTEGGEPGGAGPHEVLLRVQAEPLESYLRTERVEWLSSFASRLTEHSHWLSLQTPQQAAREHPPRGRTAMPSVLPEETAARALPPEVRRSHERLRVRLETGGVPALPVCDALDWDFFLGRYPECNRLHKKMLLTSTRVQRLNRIVRDRHARGEDVTVLWGALERAQRALFLAQNHSAYWPGPSGGIYRPELRAAAQRRLLEAQRITEAVLYPEAHWLAREEIDLDRDGQVDFLISTPRLDAAFHPQGGAMVELSYKPELCTLMDLPMRRPEAIHETLRRGGVSELGGHRDDELPPAPRHPRAGELEPRIRYDRYQRLSFLDHFLGVEATPDNFYNCQYPEVGDFLEGVYELCRVSYDRRANEGVLHLSRNGHVADLHSGRRSPLRVEKIFTFHDRDARIHIRYALTNRGHEPLSLRFGPELGFSLPLVPIGLGPATREDGDREKLESFPRTADGNIARGAAGEKSRLELELPGTGVRVRVELERPATWWWFALETVSEETDVQLRTQGIVLVPHWEVSLWGEETRVIDLVLEVLQPLEEPAAIIEDDVG